MAIDPDREAFEALSAAQGEEGPIVMVNLLKYKEQAAYPPDTDEPPCSGREAYGKYGAVALEKVAGVGGMIVMSAPQLQAVIGEAGESWDDVVLVQYPSVQAFLTMIADPEYQAATVHRTAGLERTVLLRTKPVLQAW